MKHVIIYTDGACSGNPGPGGWGALLRYGSVEKELSGFAKETTNNQMELKAAIEALKALQQPCKVDLYTDSTYVQKGITEWVAGWKQKNWKNSQKKEVKNKQLWQELDVLNQKQQVQWHWVKGHDGHPENERVDSLAREAIQQAMAQEETA